jgi:hypothetical protein
LTVEKRTRQEINAEFDAGKISRWEYMQAVDELRKEPPQFAVGDRGELSVYFPFVGEPFLIPMGLVRFLFTEDNAARARDFIDSVGDAFLQAGMNAARRRAEARKEHRGFELN